MGGDLFASRAFRWRAFRRFLFEGFRLGVEPKNHGPAIGQTRIMDGHVARANHLSEFKKRGAVILGVSTDPVKSHDKFVEKFKLPFTLLADEDKKIVEAYGVWGEKSFMGRKYLGVYRVTFLIGPDGKIKKNLAGSEAG